MHKEVDCLKPGPHSRQCQRVGAFEQISAGSAERWRQLDFDGLLPPRLCDQFALLQNPDRPATSGQLFRLNMNYGAISLNV